VARNKQRAYGGREEVVPFSTHDRYDAKPVGSKSVLVPPLVAAAAVALIAAAPATSKDGVKATLTTAVPLHAVAGTQVTVAWKLATSNGRPFGGGDIFVRLLSSTHARAQITFVDCSGSCKAKVRVPQGGIRDIQIGNRGSTFHVFRRR
jgi:hypothetical protein